ncbi:MAG: type II toxin-antitoxin system RelE/ParE family toxin [Deltaproteobacteria bacterium]|nr:type II toxin-antitoxin system RelE/ParE family toxin [Deltaproteobacteria bacterium]
MKIYQSRSFEKKIRRFSKKDKSVLDGEVKKIVNNPSIGEEKKGDLKGVFVHKFKLSTTQQLLAYRFVDAETLELIKIGPHGNYYRDLKSYLKSK